MTVVVTLRGQDYDVGSDHLRVRVAENPGRRAVPARDRAVRAFPDDRIIRRLDN